MSLILQKKPMTESCVEAWQFEIYFMKINPLCDMRRHTKFRLFCAFLQILQKLLNDQRMKWMENEQDFLNNI